MRTARAVGISARLALAGLIALALAADAAAHPTATTEVAITVHPRGTFEVALTLDADALLAKLEALGGGDASASPLTPDARDGRIMALQHALTDHLEIRFDRTRVTPRLEALSTAPGKPAIVRLTGWVPAGATQVTWRTSLVYGSYPLTVQRTGGEGPTVQWLQGPEWSEPFPLVASTKVASRGGAMLQYLFLGFTHILPNGFDHILFVLGLFFLTRQSRRMFAQVSAFTLAHSITLGLSLYGIVSLPASIVEPLIALSIAYVAIENLFTTDLRPWRLALVFAFGLLHGLGFAEALAHLNLARSEFLTTLVMFNAGVELGQLAVIALAALVVRGCAVPAPDYRRRVVWPASAAIAAPGVFWTIQRLI